MIITTTTALFFALGAKAQDAGSKATAVSDPREQCLMATGADWARLGISQDQILRVNEIQSLCLQDCVAAKGSGAGTSAVLDRHIAELRGVLTPEQFGSWKEWCAEKVGSGDK